jgi:chorismate mutase
MWEEPKYLVVETKSLPDIFVKVVYAKSLLESGVTSNISLAAKMAGISRSAIYKYRDVVFPYVSEMSGKVVSLYVAMRDRPGMLSRIISALYQSGANILTINQNIPVDGLAAVSLSVSIDASSGSSDMDLITALKEIGDVVEVRRLAGG